MADALDIEETNRLRAALGMPLLPTSNGSGNLEFKTSGAGADAVEVESDQLDARIALADSNWQKLNDIAEEKKRKEAKRATLKKQRDAAQRFARLEGKGLGEADDDQDTRSWLLGSSKRQKEIAKERAAQLQKELEERENLAQYTDKDLAGRRVAHEISDFNSVREHILTLKDAVIGDESDDDELENVELREREKLEERLKLKKKRAVYDPNAIDENGETAILGQYDEEIDGKKKYHFTLDGQGRTVEETGVVSDANASRGMQFSLDLLMDSKPVSDYMDISEIKVKKPKKKKDKARRQRPVDEDGFLPPEAPVAQSTEGESLSFSLPTETKRKYDDISFIDDDDLQANLATQRWAALKKRKKARPEDIARQLREEAATPDMDVDEEEGGLVIDETSEFVANLQRPKAPESRATTRVKKESPGASPAPDNGETGDVKMDNDSEDDEDEDVKHNPSADAEELTTTGLADEETFTTGLGATMGMLRQRGLVKDQSGAELNTAHSRKTNFMHDKERLERDWEKHAVEKRRRDREMGVFDRMSKRQQEEYAQQQNKERDQYVSRKLDELFNKGYRPNVELKYVDEFGRRMNSREAFKQMSHQFHGKGSGKQKTEKRLKRIAEEKTREAKSNLDATGSGMSGAQGTQARKQGAAGVRLQ